MKPKRKRILLNENMFGQIHWEKDSGGPEQFELIIYVKSLQEINTLKKQLMAEHEKYPKMVVKEKLKYTNLEKLTKLIHKKIIQYLKNPGVCDIEIICKDMDGNKIKSTNYNTC